MNMRSNFVMGMDITGFFLSINLIINYIPYSKFIYQHQVVNIYAGISLNEYIRFKNNPPEVKIIEPENNSTQSLNSLIRYSITVSDVEDGESKFDEIPPGKVFLEIKYMEGTPQNSPYQEKSNQEEPLGLTFIRKSDCFTCHQFKTKLIGPSFQELANRYSRSATDRKILANRILEGSTGIWGDQVMPAHNELSRDAAEKIIDWILENGSNPKLNYLVGIEGTFRLELPTGGQDGYFTLRAIYTDKGLADQPDDQQTGEDLIILHFK